MDINELKTWCEEKSRVYPTLEKDIRNYFEVCEEEIKYSYPVFATIHDTVQIIEELIENLNY